MPTELVNLELDEVSLVDMGDDPLAKVAIFKRAPSKGKDMEEDIKDDLEKGYKEDMDKAEDDTSEEDMAEDEAKPARKSWKAEAIALKETVKSLEDKIALLEQESVEKASKEEMIEVGGEKVAKSSIPAPVLKQLEEMQKAAEQAEFRKLAEEILPNFKGTLDQRTKLVKFAGGDKEILDMLKAADAAFAGVYQEVGKTDSESDLKTPTEKLKDMVKAYQEEKGEKDFYKAYAAVTKTAEGKALLLKSYKE